VASQPQIYRLKQSVTGWNAWRKEYPEIKPELRNASLISLDLSGADLRSANLRDTDLSSANLSGANLSSANLRDANLSGANLSDANLGGAYLHGTNLSSANLRDTNLSGAILDGTIFTYVDLRLAKGLIGIRHYASSIVQLHSVQLPQDGSALHFLRGTGIPDHWIALYQAEMMHPIQYHSVFISYSSKDDLLAQRLYADLQVQGVRCWFAPEDLKIGEEFRQRIDEAIHLQDKLLLLLSKDSIKSPWVKDEVEAAVEKENRQHREVLFPIRLDNTVIDTPKAWAAKLRRTRHIGDFTNWSDAQAYQKAFERLVRDLKQN